MKKLKIRTEIYNLRPLSQPIIAVDSNDEEIVSRNGETILIRYQLMLKVNRALLDAQTQAETIVRENGSKAYIGGISRDNKLMSLSINDITLGQLADSLQASLTGDEITPFLGNTPIELDLEYITAGDEFTNRDPLTREEFTDHYTKDHVKIASMNLVITDDDRDYITDRALRFRTSSIGVKAPIKRVRNIEVVAPVVAPVTEQKDPTEFDEVAFIATLPKGLSATKIAAEVKKAKSLFDLANVKIGA